MNFQLKYVLIGLGLGVIILVIIALVYGTPFVQKSYQEDDNQEEVATSTKEYDLVLSIWGDAEVSTLIMADGSSQFFLNQEYAFTDKSGNSIDPSQIESVQIKYPEEVDFRPLNAHGISGSESAFHFHLPIWPTYPTGDYVFRINYKDGSTVDQTANWAGLEEVEPRLVANEEGGPPGYLYALGDLDLSAQQSSYYHITPLGKGGEIETLDNKYVFISKENAFIGTHKIIVRQDTNWYIAYIDIN